MSSTLNNEIIVSISDGSHGDPFSVLGLHRVLDKNTEKFVIRAFRPEAKKVFAKIGKAKPLELQRISDEGLFEAIMPQRKNRFEYTLLVHPHNGEPFEIEDAYNYNSLLSNFDLQLWGEGNHQNSYDFMGAHPREVEGVSGVHFVVTAPSANKVSVVSSFNNWDGRVHRMRKFHEQGLWELFIPNVAPGDYYKFEIKTQVQDAPLIKADPFAFYAELRPGTASIVSNKI